MICSRTYVKSSINFVFFFLLLFYYVMHLSYLVSCSLISVVFQYSDWRDIMVWFTSFFFLINIVWFTRFKDLGLLSTLRQKHKLASHYFEWVAYLIWLDHTGNKRYNRYTRHKLIISFCQSTFRHLACLGFNSGIRLGCSFRINMGIVLELGFSWNMGFKF